MELWQRAKQSIVGLEVQTPDPARLRARLYASRVEMDDPELNSFSLIVPRGGVLWIVRQQYAEKMNEASGRPASEEGNDQSI